MTVLLHDGRPRFKLIETSWLHFRGPALEIAILDRACCHEVIWCHSSAELPKRMPHLARVEAIRNRARGALYEIEAEVSE